jgi:ABC-type spermidine/putrescine transport system permease subunit II
MMFAVGRNILTKCGRVGLWVFSCLVIIFLIAPILVVITVSFNDTTLFELPPVRWSLRWYGTLLDSREWREAFWLSLSVASAVAALALVLGVPAGYALARSQFAGRRLLEFVLISPMVVPVIVLALALYALFARLGLIGRPVGLFLAHTVLATPVVIVIVGAAFRRADAGIELAARACGASFLRAFWSVSLPLVRPALISAGAFAFLTSFDEVVLALFLGGPGATTLPKRIWEAVKFELDPSLTAISTLLVGLTLIALLVAELGRAKTSRQTHKEN